LKELAIQPIYQGRTNGCGTACLAMVLNYYTDAGGEPLTQSLLDTTHRPFNMFTAPAVLVELAEQYGLEAHVYQSMTCEALKTFLDEGQPVLVLVKVDPSLSGFHYLLLIGYEGETIVFLDPARSKQPRRHMPFDEFAEKYWTNLRVHGCPVGIDRFALVFAQKTGGTKRLHQQYPFVLRMANAAARIIRFFV
jgi:ABC-type bacteriocin/lantibiotic exporter with double-glycine peptidase domain